MNEQNAIAAYVRRNGGRPFRPVAALIDCDGVLYDSMKNHTRAWVKLMQKNGIRCTRDEFYRYEGMTGTEIIQKKFREGAGKVITDDEARALYGVKGRYFQEFGGSPVMPGALQALEALRDLGLRRVLVTGSQQPSILNAIDNDFAGLFDEERVTGNDVSHGKPHPEPYLRGAQKAGALPQQCLVVENAPLGVQAGHAAGCFTIGVTTGPIPEKELYKSGADIVYESMTALAQSLPALLRAALATPL